MVTATFIALRVISLCCTHRVVDVCCLLRAGVVSLDAVRDMVAATARAGRKFPSMLSEVQHASTPIQYKVRATTRFSTAVSEVHVQCCFYEQRSVCLSSNNAAECMGVRR